MAAPSIFQVTLPILGGRNDPYAANATMQQNHASVSYAADESVQQGQNTTSDAGLLANQHTQHYETRASLLSGEYIQDVIINVHASTATQNTSRIPYPSSNDESDGNFQNHGFEEDDEDAVDEEDAGNEADDEDESGSDENEEADVQMPLAEKDPRPEGWTTEEDPRLKGLIANEDDPRLEGLTAEERRVLVNYMKNNRNRIMMCVNGKISALELMFGIAKGQAELISGLKRARSEISEDDEVEESQNRRAKRTKRGGDAAGSSGEPLPGFQGQQSQEGNQPTHKAFGNSQPSFTGEYSRQGALANTSRRMYTRPVGSAVQRLHADRLRRPAPMATQTKTPKFPCYPQPGDEEYIVNANYYTHMEDSQTHPSSHRQRQPGSERTSTPLNPTIEDYAGDAPSHLEDTPPADYNSHDSESESDPVEPARNQAHTAPRRAYQQPAASNVQDDPFLSDELYNGMLNGQPDAHHVGSMYTGSQQREIDEYYQRLHAPRPRIEPETNTPEDATPPPSLFLQEEPRTIFVADLLHPNGRPQAGQSRGATHSRNSQNAPGPLTHGGNAAPATRVPTGIPRPAEEPDDGLVLGDFAAWDAAWWAFVKSHDSRPLFRGHYPDEYR